MDRITIKSPAKLLWNEQNVFVGGFFIFSISSYSGGITITKSLQDIGGTTIQDDAPSLPWSLASTPWAMSLYHFVQYIYFWILNEY